MSTAKAITMIPPTVQLYTSVPLSAVTCRRVAGYARVSTDNDEQLTSYEAQVDYYTNYIANHAEWTFVGLYADEGISGTSIKRRKGFQKMIADALDGKIDLIITKTISRFARNTVDSINTVRMLKEKGVEVFFENHNLWTFDPTAELTITILSSIAQEESRNLSENVKWGHRHRMSEGRVSMPYKRFLGYEKGENGQPAINEEQAELVRSIYTLFMGGMTPSGIAMQLTSEGIPTPAGKRNWQSCVIESVLSNEKYKGDALLQKTFCTNYLTKKMKVNEGEIPQYYVTGSHPAIVSEELFDYVQFELKRRKGVRCIATSGCFAGRVICGDCGTAYGAKVWHSNSKYRRTVWQCNGKFKNIEKCTTPHFYEDELKRIFVDVMNSRFSDKDTIIPAYMRIIKALTDNTDLEGELSALQNESEVLLEVMGRMVADNAHIAGDQEDYTRRYEGQVERYNSVMARIAELEGQLQSRNAKRQAMEQFLRVLGKQEGVFAEFDEGVWYATVHQMVVRSGTEVLTQFKDGSEVPWSV